VPTIARSRVVARAVVVVAAAAAACERSDRGGAPTGDHGRSSNAVSLEGPMPDAGGSPGAATALRAFSCEKEFNSPKMPQGPLTIRFIPRSPTDVTFQLRYHCTFNCRKVCDYAADLRVENGRMLNSVVGGEMKMACRRSSFTGFALDCGTYLGSDVAVMVRGDRLSRTVNFRVPFFFTENIPDRDKADGDLPPCIPFVGYWKGPDSKDPTEAKFIDNKKLSFDLDHCRFDDAGPSGAVERK
jgi:hypothetical protein